VKEIDFTTLSDEEKRLYILNSALFREMAQDHTVPIRAAGIPLPTVLRLFAAQDSEPAQSLAMADTCEKYGITWEVLESQGQSG
jgi:hypothetical protein